MHAFGHPGITPTWQTARKEGVGTALSHRSRVWFTLAQGILTEVYYPRVDTANLRDLQFLVSDGQHFFHEEQRDLIYSLKQPTFGIPFYRIESQDPEGRYQLVKQILTDSEADALVVEVTYRPLLDVARDYALYLLANPQIANNGWHNNARVWKLEDHPLLLAWRGEIALALVTSAPVLQASVGYVGISDGWQDLADNLVMDWTFDEAYDGNVALMARLDPTEPFRVVLGFGRNPEEAAVTALKTLHKPFRRLKKAYVQGWEAYLRRLHLEPLARKSHDGERLLYQSAMVLAVHEDKEFPGAHVASLSVPWGTSVEAVDTGGYHLVWPRDLYHTATARLALGDAEAACRTLVYLMRTQDERGCWPQNFWVDGRPYWRGLQLDEAAFPVLLAWQLGRAEARDEREAWSMVARAACSSICGCAPNACEAWPMVARAARFIARFGPVTPQERWEENAGYSPATLAVCVAALTVAAELALTMGEEPLARYLCEVADYWESMIEAWTFTRCGELLPGHREYYERIARVPVANLGRSGPECRLLVQVRNRGDFQISQCCLVDPSFLDLVRYGLRAPKDPHVAKTLPVVDALLQVETPCGPVWHRYNDDGYGEHEDGRPFDGAGIGRAWPLLSGERAHYELARGDSKQVDRLIQTLECIADPYGLLPEQVWDTEDLPEKQLFLGRGTGAAIPLVWAHAEYVKLLRSVADGRVFDRVDPVYRRYRLSTIRCERVIWKCSHPVGAVPQDRSLRIEVYEPAELHWSLDRWTTVHHEPLTEIVPGVWAREFPAGTIRPGRPLVFTIYWSSRAAWEGKDYWVYGV